MSTPTENAKQTSLAGLIATLAPTALVAGVYILIFLVLRKSHRRFYAPRTYLGTLREDERSPDLPNGWFNWIPAIWKIPDIYALQHQSLDAYLFLRFLRMTVVIMFVGACITWPVLFPVYATGGGEGGQLNLLSMSHIDKTTESGKHRYFASAGCGMIFFAFILALVTRESIYYINLRQAFLLSPVYANRLSARTVLFTSVPEPYLDEHKLRKVFGDAVRRVWITADTKVVDEVVEERDKTAYKLEAAEVKLIKLANKERVKAIKKGNANPADDQPIASGDAESGSIAARWIPNKKRPTHKLGKFGLYGKKVDTINWCRTQLETLIPQAEAAQASYRNGETEKVGSVFIEFAHQSDAQTAFQTLSHHQALHMSPKYIGVNPNEIVWKSQRIQWHQRVLRRILVVGFICALIVFWAIPVAFVGLISNITYLETFSWLAWLKKVPTPIMGVISGLLPSVALAILMSLVPIFMRICAKLAGEPSLARVELFTQNAYFAFQVVQVFLVVTIASSASSILKDIIDKPTGITSLLAARIPTVSNFYISYFIVQGLTVASGVISQVVGFVVFQILYKYLSGTPRKMYNKWANLSAISWGSTLPVFTNIAVIGIVYSCIAPLVLGFATIGMAFFYLAFRYNILFVTDSQIDTKGLIYPRALQHLLTGVYIAEICLIGLFGIATTPGPLVLMIITLIFTILYHISLNTALDPLLYTLPRSLESEEEFFRNMTPTQTVSGDSANHQQDAHNGNTELKEKSAPTAASTNLPSAPPSPPTKKPNFLAKFLKPHIYADYPTLRRLVPHGASILDIDALYPADVADNAYLPPSVTGEVPLLWIPRDEAGVSAQEVADTAKVIGVTDEGCVLNEKGKLVWDAEGARPPLWEEKICY